MKLVYSFILLLLPLTSFAQNKVGNGGDGVFCEKKGTIDSKLLDFYEADVVNTTKEKKPEAIAQIQLDKIKDAAPQLFKQYKKRLSEITSEIEFKDNIKLTDIKDSLHLFEPLPKSCKVYQIAIRKPKIIGNEKRFIIRNDLWKRLPPIHQAGLLTHEIIYEHLAKLGETDSVKARKINSYLYSNAITASGFWNLIKDLELPIYP